MVKIRYRFIESQALDFFKLVDDIRPDLLYFPLNMICVIQSFKSYKIWSYQHYSEKFKIPINQVIINCQSNSGCTFYHKESNSHLIVFNKSKPQGRQRWTLAHELGHCFLNHFDYISTECIAENNITSIFDKTLESEADYFASIILAPFPLYKPLNIKSKEDVQRVFGLSEQASENRISHYLQWESSHYKNSFDTDILKIFQSFILDSMKT